MHREETAWSRPLSTVESGAAFITGTDLPLPVSETSRFHGVAPPTACVQKSAIEHWFAYPLAEQQAHRPGDCGAQSRGYPLNTENATFINP